MAGSIESVQTTLTYIEIITEAKQGSLLVWGPSQVLPEIKHRPDRFFDYMRYTVKLWTTPDFEDKLIFLMRDIDRISRDDDVKNDLSFLGPRLATIHNLHYYQQLMRDIRHAIAAGTLEDFTASLRETYAK